MHFEREALNAMLARIFGGILPVRNDFFFSLPVLHLGVFGRPAIGDPVRLGVLRSAARATGKTDDHFHIEHFGEQDGLAECIDIFLGVLRIGMNGIAMTTESGDANSAVFKLFQPGSCFTAVVHQVDERTMTIVRIAAGTDLHGFQAESGLCPAWRREKDGRKRDRRRRWGFCASYRPPWGLASLVASPRNLTHGQSFHRQGRRRPANHSWQPETLAGRWRRSWVFSSCVSSANAIVSEHR